MNALQKFETRNCKLQNCKLQIAVSHEKSNAKGL